MTHASSDNQGLICAFELGPVTVLCCAAPGSFHRHLAIFMIVPASVSVQ